MRAALLATLLALVACEGAPVVVDLASTHDAQADAPELGSDAAPDVARGADAGAPDVASADVSTPSDAGVDVSADVAEDLVDQDDGAAPSDAALPCNDAGRCLEPDGSYCVSAEAFGCTPYPMGVGLCASYDWRASPYECTNTAAPCGHPQGGPGVYCCTDVCR